MMRSSSLSSVFLLTLVVLLSPLLRLPVAARWADHKEASIKCLNQDVIYKVKKDGTWTMESEIQLEVLNETGRQALSTQIFTYDATLCTLEVVEAKTITNGVEVIVPKHKIEVKPLASDPTGLKEEHQILVPFERVADGSVIHFKLRQHFFKPQFENYFSKCFNFGESYLWENNKITLESELPLFLKVNDPSNSLNIKETKSTSKYTLQVSLKKPIFEALVGESKYSYGEPGLYTSLSLSSESDYKRLGKIAAKFYQPVLGASLPKELENIRASASKIDNEIDCIDTVVSFLIEKINYLGSWNTAEGHLTPRSLEAIITSGYGDCKEYSACLAAILNALGYKAKIALVNRSNVYLEDEDLPNFHQFNHAIVKAVTPSGKTYWIDPTNNVSMAEGIFPDIANRPVEVLDIENPTYERTPSVDYQHALFNYERTITLKEGGYVHTEGTFCFEGESAQDITQALNLRQSSLVKEALINDMCFSDEPVNPVLDLPECKSRVVKPFKATFSYGEHYTTTHTNLGDAFPLAGSWYKPYIATSQKYKGALYVGHPETFIRKTIFKNVSAQQIDQLAFSIRTPWLNAKRELSVTKDGVTVIETIEKLKSIISAKDLKSKEFEKLKNTLRQYCDGVAIIFSQPNKKDLATSSL